MAAVVLGVILGQLGESAFIKSMQLLDYNPLNFFTRPVSAMLLVLGIASLAYSIYRASRIVPDGDAREPRAP